MPTSAHTSRKASSIASPPFDKPQEELGQSLVVRSDHGLQPPAPPELDPAAVLAVPGQNDGDDPVSVGGADDLGVLERRDAAQVADYKLSPAEEPLQLGPLPHDEGGTEEVPRLLDYCLIAPGQGLGFKAPAHTPGVVRPGALAVGREHLDKPAAHARAPPQKLREVPTEAGLARLRGTGKENNDSHLVLTSIKTRWSPPPQAAGPHLL